MDLTSTATGTKKAGVILTLVFFQRLIELESYPIESEHNRDIYRNISPICPKQEFCRNRQGKEDLSSFFGCQCDKMCSVYEDCCRDSPFFIPSDESKTKFSCIDIPIAFSRNIAIKVISKCPPDASGEEHRLCETLDKMTTYLLSVVPITVTENNSSVIYRNVYCARCNRVTNASYQLWNTTLDCDSDIKGSKPFPENAKAKWDSENKHWIYVEGNRTFECDMKMIQPPRLTQILPHVKCPTSPYKKQCPNGTDPQVSRLCRSYTAPVRWRGRQEIYKNQHCLICDGGGHNDVVCGPGFGIQPVLRSGIGRIAGDVYFSKYSVLLRYTHSECSPGQHYDGILKECVHLFPPRVAHYESNATPIDTCARAKLSARLCVLSADNSTVTIPKYKQNFTQGRFRLTENGEVEICEKDVPPLPPTTLSFADAILRIVGYGVSIVFLLLHLFAVLLVEELRNLAGITLASLCLALLGAYISFISGIILRDNPYLWCYACAIVTYYFFMASLFWMLVLAFDVTKVLRASVRKFRTTRGFKWKLFLIYSIIAWGAPIIACAAAYLVDNSAAGQVDEWFKPMFGLHSCWFGNPRAHLIFFVIPLAVIMLLNFSFFVYAAWVTSEDPTGQRKNLLVYVKLTILLGLSWIVGLIAILFDSDILWIIFSILNTLQGLFIFLSFTMTSKVSKGLPQILPCFGKSAKLTSLQSTSQETSFTSKAKSRDFTKK